MFAYSHVCILSAISFAIGSSAIAMPAPENLPLILQDRIADAKDENYELSGCPETYAPGTCLDAHDFGESFGRTDDGDTYAYWTATRPAEIGTPEYARYRNTGFGFYGGPNGSFTQWRVGKSSSLVSESLCRPATATRSGSINGKGIVTQLYGGNHVGEFLLRGGDYHNSSNGFGSVVRSVACQPAEPIANGHGTRLGFATSAQRGVLRHYNAVFAESKFRFLCKKDPQSTADRTCPAEGNPEPSACFASEKKPIVSTPSQESAMRVDVTGRVHVVFVVTPSVTATELYYATKMPDETEWTIEQVELELGHLVGSVSLDLDHEARAHITYYEKSEKDLWYATNESGDWLTEPIDTQGSVGTGHSIAVGPWGWIHVSYRDATNGALKYGRNQRLSRELGLNWWQTPTLDPDMGEGRTAIAVDRRGSIHIGYRHADNRTLKHATGRPGWLPREVTKIPKEIDVSGGYDVAIAVDAEGAVHFTYYNYDRYPESFEPTLWYATNASGTWHVESVVETLAAWTSPTIAISPKGQVMVAYESLRHGVRVATRLSDSNGNITWDGPTVESRTNNISFVFRPLSLSIDAVGGVHLVFSGMYHAQLQYLSGCFSEGAAPMFPKQPKFISSEVVATKTCEVALACVDYHSDGVLGVPQFTWSSSDFNATVEPVGVQDGPSIGIYKACGEVTISDQQPFVGTIPVDVMANIGEPDSQLSTSTHLWVPFQCTASVTASAPTVVYPGNWNTISLTPSDIGQDELLYLFGTIGVLHSSSFQARREFLAGHHDHDFAWPRLVEKEDNNTTIERSVCIPYNFPPPAFADSELVLFTDIRETPFIEDDQFSVARGNRYVPIDHLELTKTPCASIELGTIMPKGPVSKGDKIIAFIDIDAAGVERRLSAVLSPEAGEPIGEASTIIPATTDGSVLIDLGIHTESLQDKYHLSVRLHTVGEPNGNENDPLCLAAEDHLCTDPSMSECQLEHNTLSCGD